MEEQRNHYQGRVWVAEENPWHLTNVLALSCGVGVLSLPAVLLLGKDLSVKS